VVNVVHVTPTYFSHDSVIGGAERYVLNVMKSVRSVAGEHVSQSIISFGEQPKKFVVDDFPIQVLKSFEGRPSSMRVMGAGFRSALTFADVVHIHQSMTPFGVSALCHSESLGIPSVTTDLGGGHSKIMYAGGGLDLSGHVVSISDYAAQSISVSPHVAHTVILGPVDTQFWSPSGPLTRQSDRALCVGRILPHKGIERIIEALPGGMRLRVVGENYDSNYFEFLCRVAVDKSVDFVHGLSDDQLKLEYEKAGVYVQASTSEDYLGRHVIKPELMGLTTIEAMSMGLPTIVSDAGSLAEVVSGNKWARVFSSVTELQIALREFQQDLWEFSPRDNSQGIRDFAIKRFGFETVGEKLSSIYQEMRPLPRLAVVT